MALMVERQKGIDTDLVAALQFESAAAAAWGSPQLEEAVIHRVADQARHLEGTRAMPGQSLAGRLTLLAVTVAAWAIVAYFAPEHLRVFLRRLALSMEHYPSQTQVVAITVNDTPVDLSSRDEAAVHVPFGHAVRFGVTVAGVEPATSRVELSFAGRGTAAIVPLEKAQSASEGIKARKRKRGRRFQTSLARRAWIVFTDEGQQRIRCGRWAMPAAVLRHVCGTKPIGALPGLSGQCLDRSAGAQCHAAAGRGDRPCGSRAAGLCAAVGRRGAEAQSRHAAFLRTRRLRGPPGDRKRSSPQVGRSKNRRPEVPAATHLV